MGSTNVMEVKKKYCICSGSSLRGFTLEEEIEQERISSITGSIVLQLTGRELKCAKYYRNP